MAPSPVRPTTAPSSNAYAGTIAVSLSRSIDLTSYLAQFSVGTPPQKEWLIVDTGSPTISFFNSRSTFCHDTNKPCAGYGAFDNLTSLTSIYEVTGFNNELISFGTCDYLNDTIGVGGVATPHILFGYIDNIGFPEQIPYPAASIAGLALTCQGNGPRCHEGAGPFLLPQLKNASTINRAAVSVYLGPNEPKDTNSELILGAAYDKAKIDGELSTLKMVDPFSCTLTDDSTNYANVTSIEADIAGNHAKQAYGSGSITEGQPYLLDTGNSEWYMPPSIYNLVAPALGITNTTEQVNFVYPVDCKYKDPKNAPGHLTVRFGHASKIEVPLHELVTSFGNGTCNAAIGSGDAKNLGDPFLRNGYFIYDQEAFTVTMGQAKHTAKRNIVSYPSGGFKVAGNASSMNLRVRVVCPLIIRPGQTMFILSY